MGKQNSVAMLSEAVREAIEAGLALDDQAPESARCFTAVESWIATQEAAGTTIDFTALRACPRRAVRQPIADALNAKIQTVDSAWRILKYHRLNGELFAEKLETLRNGSENAQTFDRKYVLTPRDGSKPGANPEKIKPGRGLSLSGSPSPASLLPTQPDGLNDNFSGLQSVMGEKLSDARTCAITCQAVVNAGSGYAAFLKRVERIQQDLLMENKQFHNRSLHI